MAKAGAELAGPLTPVAAAPKAGFGSGWVEPTGTQMRRIV
jgi:hypothetical protein